LSLFLVTLYYMLDYTRQLQVTNLLNECIECLTESRKQIRTMIQQYQKCQIQKSSPVSKPET